jgi:cob(I)alamin adenosyltransferase
MGPKIYTKTGDDGTSKTISGQRKPKSDLEFEVLGSIDELNAALGVATLTKHTKLIKTINSVQSDLFQIGSYFAGIKFGKDEEKWIVHKTEQLEISIDELHPQITPLKNFILPGGSVESSVLHFARTICRRTERNIVKLLHKNKSFNNLVLIEAYFNRLADYLFTLARFYNGKGKKDVIWQK